MHMPSSLQFLISVLIFAFCFSFPWLQQKCHQISISFCFANWQIQSCFWPLPAGPSWYFSKQLFQVSDQWRNTCPSPGLHQYSPGLLQLTSGWHHRCSSLAPSVISEYGSSYGHRHPSLWPHHAGFRWSSLAANSPASDLKDGSPRVEVPTWLSPMLLGRAVCVLVAPTDGRCQSRSKALRAMQVPWTR